MKSNNREENLKKIMALTLKLKREYYAKHRTSDPYLEHIAFMIKAFDKEVLSEDNEAKFVSHMNNTIYEFFRSTEKKNKKTDKNDHTNEH
ncbi:hypothetical protein EK599_19990 [Vibrio sp. T187]|uniref:hypothetical protein n=1 Tax=Vibrio TaxID=662 RepID=UPI0010C96AA0|nr:MULTISPECIES: hypothetical protein [Vibrio]MBW3697968.1 hypothetical protein [Vibrio sp. T187]